MKTLLLLTFAFFVLTGVNAVTNCGDLEKETTAEVMDSCTASIGSTKNYRLVVDATVDPAKWETFAKNLQTIDGVHLVIENSPLVKLDLPALAKISSSNGDFIISNNQHLTEVSIAVKQEMTLQNFKIENNPQLATLSLEETKIVKIGKDFVVAGNSAMTDMDTFDIVNLVAGNILVMNNKMLQKFEVEGLETIEISGDITVKKNSNIRKIVMGSDDALPPPDKFPRLTVLQNMKLQRIDGVLQNTQLKVRGNPRIEDFILLKLNALAKPTNDIQPLGECIFDEKIGDLTELEFCKIVESDLELADNVEGSSADVNITEITGNVHLGNAKPEQVEFLEKAKKIKGEISSSNCTFPEELYGHSVVIRPASPCPTKATTRMTDKPVDSAVPDKKPSAPPSIPSDPDHSTEGPAAAAISNTVTIAIVIAVVSVVS